RSHCLRACKNPAAKINPDGIRRHRDGRRPNLNASDDQHNDQGVNAQTPILASVTGGQPRLKIRECLFKAPSIILECGGFLFNQMAGRVNARLIYKELRALTGSVYNLLGGIHGGDTLRFPHSAYLAGQINRLAVTVNLPVFLRAEISRNEFERLAGVLSKNGVRFVEALTAAPARALNPRTPG